MSWAIGRAAWAWAKTGIWESGFAEAYTYANDEKVTHDGSQESEKPQVETKQTFRDMMRIKRTRLEVCDKEVSVCADYNYILYSLPTLQVSTFYTSATSDTNCKLQLWLRVVASRTTRSESFTQVYYPCILRLFLQLLPSFENNPKLSQHRAQCYPTACNAIRSFAQVYLYLRNASFDTYDVDVDENCMRPYVVQPVNLSNMLLVVVKTDCGNTTSPSLSIVPDEVVYENNTLVCQKALTSLKRKRPRSCIRSHPKESEIEDQCGRATNAGSSLLLTLLLLTCVSSG